MFLHVGLSILVFYAVRRSQRGYYALAVFLHTLFDVPGALNQTGMLNLYIVEVLLAIYAIVFFVIVYKVLYRKGANFSSIRMVRRAGDS